MSNNDTQIGLPYVHRGHEIFTIQVLSLPWHITDVALDTYWDYTRGGKVLIGIGDTGIDEDHPMIKGRVKNARAFAHSRVRNRPDYYDGNNHGTHVATTIAQMCPWKEAEFCIAKVLGDNGSGSNRKVAEGIVWMGEQGCNVINLSLGGSHDDPPTREAIAYVKTLGCHVLCATGNEAGAVGYPARHAIGNGAIGRDRKLAWFSNTGKHVDLVGYGVDILAGIPGGQYQLMSGTSMASPWVVAILVNRLSAEFRHLGKIVTRSDKGLLKLETFVTDLGPEGRDTSYGRGMPDLTRCFKVKPDEPPIGKLPPLMVRIENPVTAKVWVGNVPHERIEVSHE